MDGHFLMEKNNWGNYIIHLHISYLTTSENLWEISSSTYKLNISTIGEAAQLCYIFTLRMISLQQKKRYNNNDKPTEREKK